MTKAPNSSDLPIAIVSASMQSDDAQPEQEIDAATLSPTEAVSVIYDTLAERDRGEMRRILKSACALLEFECEFHDETEDLNDD